MFIFDLRHFMLKFCHGFNNTTNERLGILNFLVRFLCFSAHTDRLMSAKPATRTVTLHKRVPHQPSPVDSWSFGSALAREPRDGEVEIDLRSPDGLLDSGDTSDEWDILSDTNELSSLLSDLSSSSYTGEDLPSTFACPWPTEDMALSLCQSIASETTQCSSDHPSVVCTSPVYTSHGQLSNCQVSIASAATTNFTTDTQPGSLDSIAQQSCASSCSSQALHISTETSESEQPLDNSGDYDDSSSQAASLDHENNSSQESAHKKERRLSPAPRALRWRRQRAEKKAHRLRQEALVKSLRQENATLLQRQAILKQEIEKTREQLLKKMSRQKQCTEQRATTD